MGDELLCNLLQELNDTQYIVRVNAENLRKHRSQTNAVSSEIVPFLKEREGKLLKLVSRMLFLRSRVVAYGKECNLNPFEGIHLWLDIVNLQQRSIRSLKHELKSLDAMLEMDNGQLLSLCDRCHVYGEDRRRFIRAAQNLRWYTHRWISEGMEPKEDSSDDRLAWVGFDKLHSSMSDQQLRQLLSSQSDVLDNGRPPAPVCSEGAAVDSGASDSGVGSNISQSSFMAVTPPSSPGLLLRNVSNGNASAEGDAVAQRGIVESARLLSSSPTNVCIPHMTRSRSHESNLPKKVIRDKQCGQTAPPYPNATTTTDNSTALDSSSVFLGCDGALSKYPRSKSSGTLPRVHSGPDKAAGAAAGSATISPDSGCESCSTSTYTPRSPRGNVRILHNINHRFVRMWKPSMSQCHVCSKPLGLSAERCSDCKLKIHNVCKDKIGPTCGLTARRMRQIYELLVLGKEEGSWDVCNEEKRCAHQLQSTKIPSSVSSSFLNAYPDRFDSASSSSCNSSAPSTPAPCATTFVHSPGLAKHKPTFSFTEAIAQLPTINIELQKSGNEPRDSQSNGSFGGSTVVMSQDGSYAETGSQVTLSPDENLVDSLGSADSNFGGHQWRRDNWSSSTIRGGGSASWREWTIPIEDIRFKKESLIGRGRFGEVHVAYWHQDVAVKLLNMDHVEDERQLETFKSEVSTFRSTRHENLVLFLGCCMKPPRLGIVMNLCKGRTLHTILHMQRERWDFGRIVSVAVQMCQGLSYLHGKKIIHKDLRTKNIFIENNNKVVITDFGLFSIHRLIRSQCHADCKFLTVPENWLTYLAPEIMQNLLRYNDTGKEVEELPFSFASDVYAFGTVWYELLVGEFPFRRYAPETIIWQVGRGIKPAINNLHIPKETKDVWMLCWTLRAHDRPSFHSLLKTFEKLPRKRMARSPSYPSSISRSAESLF